MSLRPADALARLTLEIEKRLQSGITVDPDTLHFMASTLGIETPEALSKLICDWEASDAYSLLQLLFKPDEKTLIDLEALIEKHPCTVQDQGAVIQHLLSKQIEVPIRFQENGECVPFSPPRELLETYVKSLKINFRLPEKLVKSIDKHTGGRENRQIKAVLRSARIELTPPICLFLGRLLKKKTHAGQRFIDQLELCLDVFGEQSGTQSLFDLFMTQKTRLLMMQQQAARFEKQMARYNIETLMMQGIRAPHIDKEETVRQIAGIDDICMTVFGKIAPLPQISAEVNLGSRFPGDDLDKVFAIFAKG